MTAKAIGPPDRRLGAPTRRRASGPPLIPPLTVRRLSLYLRRLESLAQAGRRTVSSRQLGKDLGLTDAQVRKDMSYLGHFGRPGVGYQVSGLVGRLRGTLGTDRVWNVALVGAGSLGRALLGYRGFLKQGFRLSAAFDVADDRVGRKFGDVVVEAMDKLAQTLRRRRIRLAVLAVPAESAQDVTEALCAAGVRGILNFAPANLSVPPDVAVVPVDLTVQLEQLSYLVGARHSTRKTQREAAASGEH